MEYLHIKPLLTIFAVLYTCVLFAALIDLFFGVRRAKRLNIARTSYGYRRTITKLTNYFGLLLMLSIADIVASIILNLPYFSVIGTLGIIIVEAKSVFENLKQCEKNIDDVQKALQKLLENRESIQSILTFINSQKNDNTTTRAAQQ